MNTDVTASKIASASSHSGSQNGRTILTATDRKEEFCAYVETWRRQTRHLSTLRRIVSNPSYQSIIAMGKEVLPWLLLELQERPDHWLVALNRITGEDPAPADSTFTEAVEAWLTWGRQRGLLR